MNPRRGVHLSLLPLNPKPQTLNPDFGVYVQVHEAAKLLAASPFVGFLNPVVEQLMALELAVFAERIDSCLLRLGFRV